MSPITYSGASCTKMASLRLRSSRGAFSRANASTRRQCCATEKICAPAVWPFQRATRARPWAISSTSMSSADGSSRSSRRPESMRCQARASAVACGGGLSRCKASATAVLSELGDHVVPVAGHQMVVDHAGRLHEGIDDGWAAELEAALRQLFRHRARHGRVGGNLRRAAITIHFRTAVDKAPQQIGKARPLSHYVEPRACREHSAFDLGAVAHDAGIGHQALDFLRPVARDLLRHEAVEGAAEIV